MHVLSQSSKPVIAMNDKAFRESCQAAANAIVTRLPAGWSSAWLDVTVHTDSVDAQGHYRLAESEPAKSFRTDWSMASHIVDLQDITQRSGKARWKHAKFVLQANGSFNIQFEY